MKKLVDAFYSVRAFLRALFCVLTGKSLIYKVKWIGRGECVGPLDIISCFFDGAGEDEHMLLIRYDGPKIKLKPMSRAKREKLYEHQESSGGVPSQAAR